MKKIIFGEQNCRNNTFVGGTNPPLSGDISAATHPLQYSNTGLVRQQQQQQLAAANNSNNSNGGLLTQQLNNNGGLLSQQLNNTSSGMIQQQQQCSPGGAAHQQDASTGTGTWIHPNNLERLVDSIKFVIASKLIKFQAMEIKFDGYSICVRLLGFISVLLKNIKSCLFICFQIFIFD